MTKIKIYNTFLTLTLAGSISFVLVGAGINEDNINNNIDNVQPVEITFNIDDLNKLLTSQRGTMDNFSVSKIAEKIHFGLLNNEQSINVEGLDLSTKEAKQNYLNALIGSVEVNPCAIWTPSYRIKKSNQQIIEIIINYDCPLDDLQQRTEEYEKKANEIIKLVPTDFSDINKAKILQDLIIKHSEYRLCYDVTNQILLSSTPASTLLDGNAVCSGYARTYADLLRRIGIPAQIVISKDETHCWNIVYLDGRWYHIDISNKAIFDNLDFFCKSDTYMKQYYPEWTSQVICDDERYDNGLPFESHTIMNKINIKKYN
ncbi:MAG: transglutaminase domain-containing protein [Bacilli bacterium]|nr:transglutaminase domain-containing protein [Bacilli bacterium]